MSRLKICKETLILNLEYSKKNNLNMIVIPFNHKAELYTTIKLDEELVNKIKEDKKFNKYTLKKFSSNIIIFVSSGKSFNSSLKFQGIDNVFVSEL